MAYIPDNPNLYEHLTGYQFINFIADIYKVSHGMKQRTAIIAALVHSPKLLVLDEPFFGQFAPLIIAVMLSINCTTASSISLKGENIWIVQSIPLSNNVFLNAKILLNLSLHAVAYFFFIIVFILRLILHASAI